MLSYSSFELFLHFLLAIGVGLTIGVERTVNLKDDWKMAGMRDFIMVAGLSFVSSLFFDQTPLAWILAFATVILFTLSIFIIRNVKATDKTLGMTTLLAMPFTFLVASLPNFGAPLWIVATVVFAILLILGLKVRFYQFARTIEKHEIIDFAILIGIAISITPLIPPDAKLPIPLINYIAGEFSVTYHYVMLAALWKVVVMVSLMSFVAHFVTKYTSGKNGLAIASFLGGLVSSLATIMMLLRHENEAPPGGVAVATRTLSRRELFLGYVAANTGAVVRVIIVLRVALGEQLFAQFTFPLASAAVLFGCLTLYAFSSIEGDIKPVRMSRRPLPLTFIFKFSGILAALIIVMTMVTHYLGQEAFILASFLSGMISSAAAAVSVASNMMQEGGAGPWTAGLAIIGALLGSTFAKFIAIARRLKFHDSIPFLLPIIALAVIGFTTLWISLIAS